MPELNSIPRTNPGGIKNRINEAEISTPDMRNHHLLERTKSIPLEELLFGLDTSRSIKPSPQTPTSRLIVI